MRAYTRGGDDGSTGMFLGGRVAKDQPIPQALGAVDEAQAALGLARGEAEPGSELDRLLVAAQRDLYVLMAELATAPENRHRLTPGTTQVTLGMVEALERLADELMGRTELPTDFVLPGEDRVSATLELARTVVRRAERAVVGVAAEGSMVIPYLNRLSSVVWVMARWQEDERKLAKAETGLVESHDLEEA